jgi:hypothetical protein
MVGRTSEAPQASDTTSLVADGFCASRLAGDWG